MIQNILPPSPQITLQINEAELKAQVEAIVIDSLREAGGRLRAAADALDPESFPSILAWHREQWEKENQKNEGEQK